MKESSYNDLGKAFISHCRQQLLKEYLPKIRRCISELSEEDVWWRTHETNNSVGNLLLHLDGNIRQWVISGIASAPDIRNRPQEFEERKAISKADLLKKLEDTLREADRVLSEFDLSKLLEVRHIQIYDVTCLYAISQVVEHFAQHLGQIIYITKLRTGKDLSFYNL